jgi:hypothetical protein
MTIYKPSDPDRKQGKKLVDGPEVVIDDKIPLTDKAKSCDGGVLLLVSRRPLTNTDVLQRRRRIRCVIVLMAVVLVAAVTLAAAVFVQRRMWRTVGVTTYTFECSVQYHDGDSPEDPIADRQLGGSAQRLGSFKERVEVDDSEMFERLEIPPVLDFRRSTVLHDFEKNLTAIVDLDHARCFILPLNRDTVKPPRNLIDLYNKVKSNYYVPDAEIVRESYKVVLPPLADVEPLGFYIWNDCQFFDTYRLIKNEDVVLEEPIAMSRKKRSAGCRMAGNGFCMGDVFTEHSHMSCFTISDCIQQ